MATGTSNFKTTTISRHVTSDDHKRAIAAPIDRQAMNDAITHIENKEERAIHVGMKAIYWLAKENLPLTKYESLMELLKKLNPQT